MKHKNFSGVWKKRLLVSLLPFSVLLAMPAMILPQEGQNYVLAAAAQEQAGDIQKPKKAEAAEEQMKALNEEREQLRAQYGENKKITDGNYDHSLAVKCVNGTFVGKKTENIIAYRGIPFAGKPPVGELRWKAPVEVRPDDGVYEAYYNAKSAYGNTEMSNWKPAPCSIRMKTACI